MRSTFAPNRQRWPVQNPPVAMNPRAVRVIDVRVDFEPVPFRAPLKFGGRVLRQTDLVHVTATLVRHDGTAFSGRGSMPLGNVWSWPTSGLSEQDTAAAMRLFVQRLGEHVTESQIDGHPIEIALALHEDFGELAARVQAELGQSEPLPTLARLVAASPLDAAIHDAFGRSRGASCFALTGPEELPGDLSRFLGTEFIDETLDRYVRSTPVPTLPLYHLVGGLDPLTAGDVGTPVQDGLPETLIDWIRADRLTHFKIKLGGLDGSADLQRVLAVHRVVNETWDTLNGRPARNICYSLDFNEGCSSIQLVVDLLQRLDELQPEALARVEYIEQPMSRRMQDRPEFRVGAAAAIKPIVIDESLDGLEALELARRLGYSGVALKACKGLSESLLVAAAAQKWGLFLCVQDLTCPGASFLQSAALAAHVPGVAAIEGNGRQYCPGPNRGWAERYPGVFNVVDGGLTTAALAEAGLGFDAFAVPYP